MARLKVDVWRDLKEEISKRLQEYGYHVPSIQELRMQDRRSEDLKGKIKNYEPGLLVDHYLAVKARRIPSNKYMLFYSKEIRGDQQKYSRVKGIANLLLAGKDVNNLLSNGVRAANQLKQDNLDLLLSHWGIYHLHFDPARTGDLLFIYLKDNKAYLLDVKGHPSDDEEVWTNPELVEVLHKNWPKCLSQFRTNMDAEVFTREARTAMRNKNMNHLLRMSDGTSYFSPGGGVMTNGMSFYVRTQSDMIMHLLETTEQDAINHEVLIRKSLSIKEGDDLKLRIMFDENLTPHIYNPKRKRIINFVNREDI